MLISPQNTLTDIPRITFNQIPGHAVIQSRWQKINCRWRASSQGKGSEPLWFVTLPRRIPVPQSWKQQLLLFLASWQVIFDMTMERSGTQEIDSFSLLVLFIQIAPSSWYSQASLEAQMVKKSACNVGDLGSLSGSGRYSGEENGNPLQYSRLGNHVDRGAWWAAVDEDTTERLGRSRAWYSQLLAETAQRSGPLVLCCIHTELLGTSMACNASQLLSETHPWPGSSWSSFKS